MKPRISFLVFVFCLGTGCGSKEAPPADSVLGQPNVLIIIPDNLRRYSASYWQRPEFAKHVVGVPDPAVTPNIDALAENGVVFTQAISNFPLCSPYRGMMLTGTYPPGNGLTGNARVGRSISLDRKVPTITSIFRDAGYDVGYFGKAHWLAPRPVFDKEDVYRGTESAPGGQYINNYDTYIPEGPDRHGIDYYFQTVIDDHFDYLAYSNDRNAVDGRADGEPHRPGVFSSKEEADQLAAYIRNVRSQRDDGRPFFAIWAPNPPHEPYDDDNVEPDVLDSHYSEADFADVCDLLPRENVRCEAAPFARHYFSNVTSVDKYIGQVIDVLRSEDMLDDTIIVLSSDHGEMLGSHGRTGKNVLLTEALAIPLIIQWPNGLVADIERSIVNVPDLMPTVLGLAGLAERIPRTVQGRNLSSRLASLASADAELDDETLVMAPEERGIISGQYMLTVSLAEKYEPSIRLFDNARDPYQLQPVEIYGPVPQRYETLTSELLVRLGRRLQEADDAWFQDKLMGHLIPYPGHTD